MASKTKTLSNTHILLVSKRKWNPYCRYPNSIKKKRTTMQHWCQAWNTRLHSIFTFFFMWSTSPIHFFEANVKRARLLKSTKPLTTKTYGWTSTISIPMDSKHWHSRLSSSPMKGIAPMCLWPTSSGGPLGFIIQLYSLVPHYELLLSLVS